MVKGITISAVVLLLITYGFNLGKGYIADHCDDYGRVEIKGEWYLCVPVTTEERTRL